MKTLDFRIRKLHVNSETEKRLQRAQPSRVYVNEEALIELTGSKDGGRVVRVEKVTSDGPTLQHEATLWKAPEKLDKTVTQLYDAFRAGCGYSLGDQVRITALGGTIPDAESITVEETTGRELKEGKEGKEGKDGKDGKDAKEAATVTEPLQPVDIPYWEYILSRRLTDPPDQHVYAGMVIRLVLGAEERTFVVTAVNGRATGNARYRRRNTLVKIAAPVAASQPNGTNGVARKALKIGRIGGLDAQINKINNFLWLFDWTIPSQSPVGISGLVIHGGPGTGKTMLLSCIADCGWGSVFRIRPQHKLSEIQETLQQAQSQQPSVVLIDQLERLIDKERNNRGAVILALCDAFDALAGEARARRQRPRVVIVATCLDFTADIPADLRDPSRFETDVYLPMPDAGARREMLASFWPVEPPPAVREILRAISERTHAYNGKDLSRLFNEACRNAAVRLGQETAQIADTADGSVEHEEKKAEEETRLEDRLEPDDFEKALKAVRPSVMRDINLKPPPIRWGDIAGQDAVKRALQDAVLLTLLPRTLISRLLGTPPKGYLLYGPPGCSKTMAAQALATEAGFNFFAVKGAELLNMYVGESERAVRRLFEHAREAAPSIIFFDEIDTIAGARQGFSHGGGGGGGGGDGAAGGASGGSGSSHPGLHVVATLLTEMDGFETLDGVLILASTNRPQVIDPALLRPGRFNKLIFVGLPDAAARRAILVAERDRRAWAADVDVDDLVRSTDGYSGAELRGVCIEAGEAAFHRVVHANPALLLVAPGHPAAIAADTADAFASAVITMRDMLGALELQKRQVTPEMLEGYERWEKRFRRV